MLKRPFPIKRTIFTFLLLLVALTGFLSLNRVKNQAWWIVDDTLPGLVGAGVANADSADDFNLVLLALMATTPEEKARLCAESNRFEEEAAKYLQYYETSIFESEDRENFNRLMERRRAYLAIRGDVLVLMTQKQDKEALARYKQALLPSYTQYMAAGKVLLDYNTRQGQVRGQNIMRFSNLTQYAVAGFTMALFVLGFVVGIFNYYPSSRQQPRPVITPKPVRS